MNFLIHLTKLSTPKKLRDAQRPAITRRALNADGNKFSIKGMLIRGPCRSWGRRSFLDIFCPGYGRLKNNLLDRLI